MELQQLLSLLEVFSVRVQNYWKKVKATLSLSLSLSLFFSLSLSVLKVACHWFLDIFHFLSCPRYTPHNHFRVIPESFYKSSGNFDRNVHTSCSQWQRILVEERHDITQLQGQCSRLLFMDTGIYCVTSCQGLVLLYSTNLKTSIKFF